MNEAKMYRQLLFRLLMAIIVYTALGVAFYLVAVNILKVLYIQGNVGRGILNWLELNRLYCAIIYLIIGYVAIFLYFWKKPFSYLHEVVKATEIIHQHSTELIVLPSALKEVEVYLNQINVDLQNNERAAKEAEQRKNDLIAYLAHDLKTPLTSIVGYLSLLHEIPDMPIEQRAKYVNITLDKAKRLEILINEFFEITRYNLQQIILEKESIDLYYMLVQMTDEFYPVLSEHGNTIRLICDEDLTIYGDPFRLARVFNNILKNAIAYSYPGTEIVVEVKSLDEKIQIAFCNHGKTIPAHRLSAIFEKFFRLDEARTSSAGGAGLGLAIAKEIVTLHDGTISAVSENEITTFHIELPISNQ